MINSAIDKELERIARERGQVSSIMDGYGNILKAVERCADASKESGATLKEIWKSLKSGDEDTAMVLIGELRRRTEQAAREHIILAAEVRRAEGIE